ncbi:MAG: hypothetical protein EBV34_17920, partial [Betaproteobacteria bacterium]|nr:hypothetical protein [Betaproteobacteria bacterium]
MAAVVGMIKRVYSGPMCGSPYRHTRKKLLKRSLELRWRSKVFIPIKTLERNSIALSHRTVRPALRVLA